MIGPLSATLEPTGGADAGHADDQTERSAAGEPCLPGGFAWEEIMQHGRLVAILLILPAREDREAKTPAGENLPSEGSRSPENAPRTARPPAPEPREDAR